MRPHGLQHTRPPCPWNSPGKNIGLGCHSFLQGNRHWKRPSAFGQIKLIMGFPGGSDGKESACSEGHPGSIPGSGGSTREGIGHPLQYSWASLVAQLVKNLPAMREICVGSLDWEDPLETGKASHASILAWRIPWTIQSQRVGHN